MSKPIVFSSCFLVHLLDCKSYWIYCFNFWILDSGICSVPARKLKFHPIQLIWEPNSDLRQLIGIWVSWQKMQQASLPTALIVPPCKKENRQHTKARNVATISSVKVMENCSKTKSFWMKQSWKAGLNASLELQCRETMEIRSGAGFEAGLEGLKAMEIGAKQYDKEGSFFWSPKRKKKQARKTGLSSNSGAKSWRFSLCWAARRLHYGSPVHGCRLRLLEGEHRKISLTAGRVSQGSHHNKTKPEPVSWLSWYGVSLEADRLLVVLKFKTPCLRA